MRAAAFATSLFVPLARIAREVMRDEGLHGAERQTADGVAAAVGMWSPTGITEN